MSVQSAAAQQRLRWDPVIPTVRCDPDAFDFQWRRIQSSSRTSRTPGRFPAARERTAAGAGRGAPPIPAQAVHLAESRVVNEGASVSVRFPDGGHGDEPDVDYTFPAQDAIAGFSVLFRQCYSPEEKASFARVQSILRQATKAARDGLDIERARHLTAWARAQGQLRAFGLLALCGRALSPESAAPAQFTTKRASHRSSSSARLTTARTSTGATSGRPSRFGTTTCS